MIAWLLTVFLVLHPVELSTPPSSINGEMIFLPAMEPPARPYLNALLGSFRLVPARTRQRIEARRDHIEDRAYQSEVQHGVPMGVILPVAWVESHVGTDDGEGGNWGAPISPARRHTAGTPMHAARALAWSYRVCGYDWQRAVARFHSGLCQPHAARHQEYVRTVTRLVRAVYSQVGVPIPEGFERDVVVRR
jgi:hypothetical protein